MFLASPSAQVRRSLVMETGPVTVLEDINADLYSDGRSAGAVFDGPDLAGVGGDAFV